MSLLFQPGSTRAPDRDGAASHALSRVVPHDPLSVVRAALEVLTLGDGSRLEQIFTNDVSFRGPHIAARSLTELLHLVCSPDPALDAIEVTLSNVVIENATVAAEWLVEATLAAPVLFGDNVLIEPTDDRLQVGGASFAEFAGERIAAFRCYFDDSETFDGTPGVTQPLRFTARWSGSP